MPRAAHGGEFHRRPEGGLLYQLVHPGTFNLTGLRVVSPPIHATCAKPTASTETRCPCCARPQPPGEIREIQIEKRRVIEEQSIGRRHDLERTLVCRLARYCDG